MNRYGSWAIMGYRMYTDSKYDLVTIGTQGIVSSLTKILKLIFPDGRNSRHQAVLVSIQHGCCHLQIWVPSVNQPLVNQSVAMENKSPISRRFSHDFHWGLSKPRKKFPDVPGISSAFLRCNFRENRAVLGQSHVEPREKPVVFCGTPSI